MQATLFPRMHEGEWFAANIFTGTEKNMLNLQLKLMPESTCLDTTFFAGMVAEKYFAVNFQIVG